MPRGKNALLFCLGGGTYVCLELLWRGRSHGSMFLAGGSCFMLLGKLRRPLRRFPLPLRAAVCSGVITTVELATGEIFNRGYRVWDYRQLPLNFRGQICLPFSVLWAPLGLIAMELYQAADQSVSKITSSLSRSSSRRPA